MSREPLAAVDFSALKRRSRRLPPPPDDASLNLTAPELAPIADETTADVLPAPPATEPAFLPRPSLSPANPSTGLVGEEHDAPIAGRRRRVVPYVPAKLPPEAYDGRSRLRTGRTEPFSTRVRADFRGRLIAVADRLGCTMAEALERAVEALERDQGLRG